MVSSQKLCCQLTTNIVANRKQNIPHVPEDVFWTVRAFMALTLAPTRENANVQQWHWNTLDSWQRKGLFSWISLYGSSVLATSFGRFIFISATRLLQQLVDLSFTCHDDRTLVNEVFSSCIRKGYGTKSIYWIWKGGSYLSVILMRMTFCTQNFYTKALERFKQKARKTINVNTIHVHSTR